MRETLAEICIWILRKLKVGALINMKLEGGTVTNIYRLNYWHGVHMIEVKTIDSFGNEFIIPSNQPFRIETIKPEEGI